MPKGKKQKKKKPVITFNSTSITEGDSLTTTLANLKPRKKFFYALTGDGINEKDLDSGKIQGRLKANKKGTAVIKHIFSEDNRNEGVETFTLKVFKNKKQTRLLKESKIIKINDQDNSSKVTKKVEIDGLGKIESDRKYGIDSPLVKDFILAQENSIIYEKFDAEVEFNEKTITLTIQSSKKDSSSQSTSRTVLLGDFQYSKDTIISARVSRTAQFALSGKDYGWGVIHNLDAIVPQPNSPSSWQSSLIFNEGTELADFYIGMETPGAITGDYGTVVSFGNGRFFYDGWASNPFGQNLI